MPTKIFTSGRIRKAHWESTQGQLDLHFDSGTVKAYKQVPEEVFRRLCNAPNPATYWEDRIAEEYPMAPPANAPANAKPNWSDLFGDKSADDGGAGKD
jgi:hypothetical protein